MAKARSLTTAPATQGDASVAPAVPGTFLAHAATAGLVALATFIAFGPALMAGFVNWDDPNTVLNNQVITSLAWPNVKWMFTNYLMGHYQPLALLTLAVDYALWGFEPFGYHLTNVLIHVANGVLVYFLAAKLLRFILVRTPAPASATHEKPIIFGAAATAILFAMHPLRVESVAWITERRDVLSACFYLAATLAYVKAHETRLAGGKPRRWFCVSVVLTLVSLLTKVMAVTAPAIFLLLDWYPLRRIGGEKGLWNRSAWRIYAEKLWFILPAILLGMATVKAQAASSAWRGVGSLASLKSILSGLYGLSFYLWKTVLPQGLSPYLEMPLQASAIDWRFVVAGGVILAAGVPLLIWRKRRPGLLVAWACYMVLIFPVLGVVQNWPQIAADRYTYLPCLGLMLLIGTAVARLALANAGTVRRIGLPAGLILVSILLGALTWQQNRVWTNALTLWERVLAIEPNNFVGRLNYGDAWLAVDRPDLALPEFQSAVALHPWDDEAQTNLGLALIQLQRDDEATKPLQTAIELNPQAAKAQASLGHLLFKRGDVAGATNHFNLAVQADPADPSIHASYAWQLRRTGQLDQAIAQLTIAVQQSPFNARYRVELAGALQDAKRYTEAMDILRAGVGLTGRDPNLLDALARLLAICPEPNLRNAEEAVRLAREACDSVGERPPGAMLETLALAHKAAGHKAEALATLESASAAARQNNETEVLRRCQDELAEMRSNAPGEP